MPAFRLLLLLLAAVPLILSACAGANAGAKGKKGGDDSDWVDPIQEFEEEDGWRKVTLDLDGNESPDVINYYRAGDGSETTLLVRKEIDLNFDGAVDIVQSWKDGAMMNEAIDQFFYACALLEALKK